VPRLLVDGRPCSSVTLDDVDDAKSVDGRQIEPELQFTSLRDAGQVVLVQLCQRAPILGIIPIDEDELHRTTGQQLTELRWRVQQPVRQDALAIQSIEVLGGGPWLGDESRLRTRLVV